MARRPRVMGRRSRAHRGPPQHCRDDDLHTRLHVRRAAQPRGFVASTEGCRCRDDRRRGRGIRVRSPRTRRHRRRPAVESRAHPAVEHRRGFVERGTRPRPRHPRRAGAVAADPKARCLRSRHVLPPIRSHCTRAAAERAARVALVRRVGSRRAVRHRSALEDRRRQAGRGDRHHRAPLRRRAPVRRVSPPRQARHVDAPAERHDRPARARLHGRSGGVRAADRGATVEEADPHVAEASAGIRCRARALDPEPGRPRLQGDLERRHLDGRPTADRAGQEAAARWDVRGRGRRRHQRARRHHQRTRASASSCCDAPASISPRCSRRVGRWRTSAVLSRASRSRRSHLTKPRRSLLRLPASRPQAFLRRARWLPRQPTRRRSHRRSPTASRSAISTPPLRGRRRSARCPADHASSPQRLRGSASSSTTTRPGCASPRSGRRCSARCRPARTPQLRSRSTTTSATS